MEIPVIKDREYLWYAISYNDNNDIALPANTKDPQIKTSANKDLLWASSSVQGVTASGKNTPLSIIFKHSLTQIHVKVNKKHLYGNITSFNAKFSQDYIYTANFSIRNGSMVKNTQTPVDVGNLVFTQSTVDPDLREAIYYTSNPTVVNSYKVTIDDLKITYINGVNEILAESANIKEATLGTYSPILGKSLIGNINLHYFFETKRTILHVAEIGKYGYAGEISASFNLFNDPRNFGPKGRVRTVTEHTHEILRTSYSKTLSIKPYLTGTKKPDIIIIGQYYYFDNLVNYSEVQDIVDYVNSGGVLLLMTDNETQRNHGHREVLENLLGSGISVKMNPNGAGSVYAIKNIDDPILNGPFGDVRNGFWGEDASYTMYIENLPIVATSFSTAEAANVTNNRVGSSMFRHKTKNLFWIGDAGFLSNENENGIYNHSNNKTATGIPHEGIEPFATNSNNYPITKPYGFAGGSRSARGFDVANSIIYANFMAWALMRAEFYGINTGGLKP